MLPKHTPGPWSEGYDEANALLISAAPDLLLALSKMLKYFNEDLASIMDDELQAVFAARTAVAKALGA